MPWNLRQTRSVSTSTRVDPPEIYDAAMNLLEDLFNQEDPNDELVTLVRLQREPFEVLDAAIRYLTEIH